MKLPTYAILLLGRNCIYPVDKIWFKTKQVTLKEGEKLYNTVSVENVEFDFSDFTEDEIVEFKKAFD